MTPLGVNSIILSADRIIELTPNGVIDRYSTFDEYLNDTKVKELREKMYK